MAKSKKTLEITQTKTKAKAKFDGHKGYGNVLRCSRSGNELHPTQKPVELMEMILDNTEPGEYDPGSNYEGGTP